MSAHETAAAYALDALDDAERRAFEEHLERCVECAAELDGLRSAAAALAFAAELPSAPSALRSRLLRNAAAERPAVVPLRRRLWLPALATAAAAAIALGVWAATLATDLDRERSAHATDARALAVLAHPGARRYAVSAGILAVTPSGRAVLAVELPPAPVGRTYEAWVVPAGGAPAPAGLFPGGRPVLVALTRPVPRGALVGVTLEPAGGSARPTGGLLVRAATA